MTNFSLIIPTYNRPYYLKRILSYYNQFGEDYNIVVADSSSDENKKRNKKNISSFPTLTILYLDNYPSSISTFHKIADAANYIEKKYCTICADDDFVTPNGIKKSAEFLEKNPDFTVAQGDYISFYFKKKKRGKQNQFCWAPDKQFDSITFSDAKSRLDFHLSNYQVTTFYAVHRTDFLKMILEETIKFTDDNRFGELLPSMLTLIYGKMKRIDVLFTARDVGSAPMATDPKYFYRLKRFIENDTYDEKYAKFKSCLVFHLNKKSNLSLEESEKVIDNAMSRYINLNTDYKDFLMDKIKYILDCLKATDLLYERIKSSLRALNKKYFSFKERIKYSNSISNLPSEYCDDFNKIRNCVMSHIKI